MGLINVKSNASSFVHRFDVVQRIEQAVVTTLSAAGQIAVDKARATKTYEDRTGNLTDSIGYGVVLNGRLVDEGGFGGGEGGAAGKALLADIAGSCKERFGLFIVAGMDYALYVERKGFVVLDGGTLGLPSEIDSMFERIRL